jgi:hypothetical protein
MTLPPTLKLPESIIRTAWKTGELGYRLRNGQKKVRQAVAKSHATFLKFYVECTRRFGKSTYGLIWLTEGAEKNPGSVSAFFAPVKEGLKDYILPIITQTFSDCPDDLRPTLDSSLTLTFPNGSKIIFRGSNNQQHRVRRGNAFLRAFVDEARDVDDLDNLIDSVIIPSLFSTMGRLLISSTPADTEDHPLYAIKQAAEKEGWYFRFTIYDAHRYDPADFPLERIETWKKETTDRVAWEREYEAKWVKDPTKTVIPEWDGSGAYQMERDEFFQFYHKYAALDSGVTDKTAGLLAYYDFKKAKLVVEDEFALQDAEVRTDRIAGLFKTKEAELDYQATHDRGSDEYRKLQSHERTFRRVADNNNLILINDLNSLHHLDFFPTRKDDLAAMVNLVREWVKDGRIVVSPKCKELLGCLNNAVWDKNRAKLAKSKIYGHFDALMALVYLVRNIDTQTNPIPKFYGKSWATHPGVPADASNPQRGSDAIVRMFRQNTERDQARSDFAKGRTNGLG